MSTCNLVGCMSQYSCGSLKQVVQGTNLAPYVRCYIEGSNFNITVGNQSDPDNGNQAVIKSFQIGGSNGAGMEIEIHDEQGGNFEAFMTKLNKTIEGANSDYKMRVQWGWINTDCGQTSGGFGPLSEIFIFIPLHVEASFSDGKIKYKLVGTSLLEVVFEARQSIVIGSDDNKITLKAAIRQLFKNGPPQINSVQFYRIASAGTTNCGSGSTGNYTEWSFSTKNNGCDGPEQKWESNQQNKLSAAMAWLKSYPTDRGKGVTPVWNPSVPGGELIFFEDPVPACNETINWCSRSIGTYIVNGGSCSPVISFTPSAKWVYSALNQSGGGTGVTTGKNIQDTGRPGCNAGTTGAGTQTATPVDVAQIDQNGFDSMAEYMAAQAAYGYANKRMYSMEAELRIQGDPSIAGPLQIFARSVSLVVISPFHIEQSGTCGDWLAQPGCHPVYSNNAWWIKGVDHMIKEGSYVTTLRLVLVAPGSEANLNSPFGASPTGWNGTS